MASMRHCLFAAISLTALSGSFIKDSLGYFCGKAATTGPHLVYTSVRLPAILLRTRSDEADDGVDNTYNPNLCPGPYCACTSSMATPIAYNLSNAFLTEFVEVSNYRARASADICPYRIPSEAGSRLVVSSKTESTCWNGRYRLYRLRTVAEWQVFPQNRCSGASITRNAPFPTL